jgi:deoxyribodipyrimidine photolyase
MFWKDIAEIKEWMNRLTDRMVRMDHNIEKVLGYAQEASEQKCNKLEVSQKLETNLERLEVVLELSESSFDKIDRYISNLEKYNGMINELKGCVSLARSAVLDRKQVDSEQSARVHQLVYHVETLLKDNCKIIDCLHKNIEQFASFMQQVNKKAPKKKKPVKKKKAVSPAPESE